MARNIVHMALPMTVAQLINILYNVVDRMYLGRLPGHLALTGLGLCLPIISILMAFANLCGMGGAPLCSIHRGRGENGEAERIMGNSFALLLLFGAGLTVLCLAFRRPILYLFGASDVTFPYANDYLTIYVLGTVFVMIGLGMNPFINSQGFSGMGMLTVALGAVVNIVLDPIFIFLLGMGVRGAALATVISQACSAVWVLVFLTGRKAALRLRPRYMVLKPARVRKIVSLGLSGFFMNLTNSLVQIVCNATLQACGGDLYVGTMTVITSVVQLFSTPLSGYTNGVQPLMSFNYGAGNVQRVRRTFRLLLLSTVCITMTYCALIELFPRVFITLFARDEALIELTVRGLRIYAAGLGVFGLQNAIQSMFVGLGQAKISLFIAVLRKIILLIPLALILPLFWGVTGVYVAEPIADVLSATMATCLMLYHFNRILDHREAELRHIQP